MTGEIGFDALLRARQRIEPHVHRTPVLTSATIDAEVGAAVFFKCENLQKVGAFKARGAVNAVLSLSDEAAARGVATHSSGNHAAALAYAAKIRGIPCTVVMPDAAPAIKVDAVRGYGAKIVFCARADRERTCAAIVTETGASYVSPFDDGEVIAGQGTAGLELLEDVPDLDLVLAPVGGGGLLAGTALAVEGHGGGARCVGAEPEAVDDAYRSLATGVRQPAVADPVTLADGLMTGLGVRNFAILTRLQVEIVTVTEAAIAAAARDLAERMKIVVEPSGATVLAAIRARAAAWRGLRIGAILTGGNTDFDWLCPRPRGP